MTKQRHTIKYSILPFLLLSLTLLASANAQSFEDLWNQYVQQTPKKYDATIARRERNLDHWDVPTAAAYLGLHPETLKPLPRFPSESSASDAKASTSSSNVELVDEYIGHDAAILFYAQWCHNCHAVAPSWDAIATHVNAGSRSSKLVMALFDCEKDTRHMELCVAAGVKAYPTMMFVGSGEYHDTDVVTRTIFGRDKSAGPFGATTLRRTVKFQGNWQYGDQILDWVNLMRGLSSWHSATERGPLKNFRNGIFGLLGRSGSKSGRGKDSLSLPVGVPPGFQPELRSGSAASGENQKDVHDLEVKLNATNKKVDLYEKAVKHSNSLLDGLLFPVESNKNATTPRDIFTLLTDSGGWFQNATTLPVGSSNDQHPKILRSCAAELSIDYCTRISTRETNSYVEELGLIPDDQPFPTMEEIEQHLVDAINVTEPYCAVIETCILTDYEKEECRPRSCPFKNQAACSYVQNCFGAEIQDEYARALGIINEGESLSTKNFSAGAGVKSGVTDVQSDKSGVGGWGIPASDK
jgi:thiol-disulfide isomerase/thioredoxin